MRVDAAWLSALSMLVQVPARPVQVDAQPRQFIVDGQCGGRDLSRPRDRCRRALRPALVPFPPGAQRRMAGLPAEPREQAGAGRCGWLGWQGPAASCEVGG
jgi:hypothetical protein